MLRNICSALLLIGCMIHYSNLIEAKVYSCNSRSQCGCSRTNANIDARIVGGEMAVDHSWGWAVSLRDISGSNFCGGVILSPSYVLTAAHCLTDLYSTISRYSVEVGTNLIQQNLGQVIPFSAKYIHPNYDSATHENDIAIIRLARPITFTDSNVARLCLPAVNVSQQSLYPVVGKPLVAIGWGTLSSGGLSTYSLRQVTVYTVGSDESKCRRTIRNTRLQFCAAVDGGGKDTCQGDSGGPIMHYSEKDQLWVLAGLTSYGRGCGLSDYAGVYTRVSPYLDWIRSILGSEPFITIPQDVTSDSFVLKQSLSLTFAAIFFVPMLTKIFHSV